MSLKSIALCFLVHSLSLLALLPHSSDSLIITSVIAGDKKFKTISFDTKFLKPLMFEKELPNTEFRRHRTLRPPKFDIDVNIPIKLPLEDEYNYEEPLKQVTSDFSLQSGDIIEKYPSKTHVYNQQYPPKSGELNYAGSTQHKAPSQSPPRESPVASRRESQELPNPQQAASQHRFEIPKIIDQRQQNAPELAQESRNYEYSSKNNYGQYQQEFVPGGFINLQLSGPTGGPKMTYQDYDREKWAQTLSQTAGAMPFPILNYQQLQNFYGGLGTFTNGLPNTPYAPASLLEKVKSSLGHITSSIPHFG